MAHLYVHIPFCTHRCGYCDFVATENLALKTPYLEALHKEGHLLKAKHPFNNLPLKTLYIGGGTPSALNTRELDQLLSGLQEHFGQPTLEYTIEMNPETVTKDKVRLLAKYGVNRVSLGLQAKQPQLLALLERKSNFEQVEKAVGLIKAEGIKRLSLDVIYGIPGQTEEDLLETLEAVMAMRPDHLSCYALKLEPHTPMGDLEARGELTMPSDEVAADQLALIVTYLKGRGYKRYEVSNFALEGFESQHNLAYWTGVDTLGLGAGSVYLVDGKRYSNEKDILKYINDVNHNALPIESVEVLEDSDFRLEYLMLRLRLASGISLNEYRRIGNVDLLTAKGPLLARLAEEGLIEIDGDTLRLTDAGMAIENAIIVALE